MGDVWWNIITRVELWRCHYFPQGSQVYVKYDNGLYCFQGYRWSARAER